MTAYDLNTGATRWSIATGPAGTPGWVPAMVGIKTGPNTSVDRLFVPISGQSCGIMRIDPSDGRVVGTKYFAGPAGNIPPGSISSAQCNTSDALASGEAIIVPYQSLGLARGICPDGTDLYWNTIGVVADNEGSGNGSPGNPGNWSLTQGGSNCGSPPPSPGALFQPMSIAGDQVVVSQGAVIATHDLVGCLMPPCPPSTSSWTVDVGGPITGPPIVLANGDVAVARTDGQLVVVDGTTHAVEWTATLGASSRALAASGTTIFATGVNSSVTASTVLAFAVDGCGAATCSPLWSTTANAGLSSGRPSIGGDVLYVPSGRTLKAFATTGCGAATCEPLWSASVGASSVGPITGLPAVHDGVVVVGTAFGHVVAYKLPASTGSG